MAADALVIFAKWPLPGQVKTRLCPPLRPDQAAELARCFLLDTVERVSRLEDVQVWVAFTPAESEPRFRALLPASVRYLPQRGNDLGEREWHVFVDLFEQGAERVAIMGSDIPSVPLAYLRSAFALLESPGCDAVLGPSRDGGYYLIGAPAGQTGLPALFEHIEWSTEKVMQQTLQQAGLHHLNVSLLPAWYDVDTVEDMRKLAEQLQDMPSEEGVSRTRSFLERIGEKKTPHPDPLPEGEGMTTVGATPCGGPAPAQSSPPTRNAVPMPEE